MPAWMSYAMGNRDQQILSFIETHGWSRAKRQTLADDASFRRYDRLTLEGRSAVLMHAPPDKEDVRPFITIAAILRDLGLSAPKLYAQDPEHGLLLLEDLGDDTYTRVLATNPEREHSLYSLATDLLITLHSRFSQNLELPQYDDACLHSEANLLLDWYLPAVTGKKATDAVRQDYEVLWHRLFQLARVVPSTLVLRDYHVDNLMWLPRRPGFAACGLLDFQDAVIGPVTYDLVSLFEDARRDVPAALARKGLNHYLEAFPDLDPNALYMSYAILGAQRCAKILGIFTRLDKRDSKPDYLCHLPRVWRWLEADLAHPVLCELRAWFDRNLPPANRVIPERTTRE